MYSVLHVIVRVNFPLRKTPVVTADHRLLPGSHEILPVDPLRPPVARADEFDAHLLHTMDFGRPSLPQYALDVLQSSLCLLDDHLLFGAPLVVG